jgi:hypothetical protein
MAAHPESAQRQRQAPAPIAAHAATPGAEKRRRHGILLVALFVSVELVWIGGLATLAAWLLFS